MCYKPINGVTAIWVHNNFLLHALLPARWTHQGRYRLSAMWNTKNLQHNIMLDIFVKNYLHNNWLSLVDSQRLRHLQRATKVIDTALLHRYKGYYLQPSLQSSLTHMHNLKTVQLYTQSAFHLRFFCLSCHLFVSRCCSNVIQKNTFMNFHYNELNKLNRTNRMEMV